MKEEYREQYRKFGLNVVYYRKGLRITQLQLAELLDIQRSHISAIELGNVGVSLDLIFKCARYSISNQRSSLILGIKRYEQKLP